MALPANIALELESDGIARVRCKRCGEQIGRLQAQTPSQEDPRDWHAQVQGEIELIAREHEDLCPKALASTKQP